MLVAPPPPRIPRRARASGRSRKEQGDQTRQAILRAAVELYAEAGVRGTGLMAIGERAGVHHATVLYHYRSSRDLLVAVLEERDRQFLDFAHDSLREGGLTALANLPMVARFHVANPMWAKLFTVLQAENLDQNADAHAYFLERRRRTRKLLAGFVRTGKARSDIRAAVDEQATAEAIMAFMAGAQLQYFLDPKRVDLVAVYERFTAMLLRDLSR
jgi:AcrR family transcriptional regulator